MRIKLLGAILYQILCKLLKDDYDKYVYNNKYCISFNSQLSHVSVKKIKYKICLQNKRHKSVLQLKKGNSVLANQK